MKLRFLIKSEDSRPGGQCPAVYAAENPAVMVCQGRFLDPDTAAELRDVADDETAVSLPTETLLRAAAMVLDESGHPDVADQVESFLATQTWRTTR